MQKPEPEVIQMVDEADAILVELVRATRMGRGRVIAVALEHMLNGYLGDPSAPLQDIIARVRDARSVPEIGADAIEVAKLPR